MWIATPSSRRSRNGTIPSLADKPVIIGGGRRGVVSTACYIARTYGVRSAMPMFQALKACPHAVVIRPNMDKYRVAGRAVRRMMLDLTPMVEPVSIDEAFLDLSGTERLHHGSPALTLARFARRVEDELGITISVGLSCNKFLAKVASDFEKPRGFSIIGRAEAADFLADKPVAIIPGIGAAAQARLARAGVTTIAHLRAHHPENPGRGPRTRCPAALAHRLGRGRPAGEGGAGDEERLGGDDLRWRHPLVRGAGADPVAAVPRRSRARLKKDGHAGRSVTLKLKDTRFRLLTRTRSGLPATQLAARLFEPARQLLKAACDGTAYRLIGIGASDLCDPAEADQGDLADQSVVARRTPGGRDRQDPGAVRRPMPCRRASRCGLVSADRHPSRARHRGS